MHSLVGVQGKLLILEPPDGRYWCLARAVYRLLAAHEDVREGRQHLRYRSLNSIRECPIYVCGLSEGNPRTQTTTQILRSLQ